MKRLIVVLSLMLALVLTGMFSSVKAENGSSFEGDWIGIVHLPEGRKLDVRLKIENNSIMQFYKDKEMFWQPMNLTQPQFIVQDNNALFSWLKINYGQSETMTFALTFMTKEQVRVNFTRRNNFQSIFDGNYTKQIEGDGTLWRVG